MSLEQLRDEILSKKTVVHTRFAEQFITEPHDVESAYNHHYHTHISLGRVRPRMTDYESVTSWSRVGYEKT
jgi:hypothetical protein